MENVVAIGSAEHLIQKLLDSYISEQGAVAASLLVTFPDGRQIRLGGGDTMLSCESLKAAVGL